MSHARSLSRATCPIIAAVLAALGAPGLHAQPALVGEPVFELTVVAPRLVRRQASRDSVTGAPVELVSLTRRVSYTDLDLAKHADVLELDRRIERVAREACEQLASVFPLSDEKTPDCVSEAVAGAKAQAERVVAAAAR